MSVEKGQTNVILASGSASGHVLPPMIIFPLEGISLDMMKGSHADTMFTGIKCGWVNGCFVFAQAISILFVISGIAFHLCLFQWLFVSMELSFLQ